MICNFGDKQHQQQQQQSQTMDDLHSFHKRQYDKSADLEKLSRWRRLVMLVKLLPRFIFKVILVFTAELYYSLLRPSYRYFVPKLMDIRGQVAVVSEISILYRFHNSHRI